MEVKIRKLNTATGEFTSAVDDRFSITGYRLGWKESGDGEMIGCDIHFSGTNLNSGEEISSIELVRISTKEYFDLKLRGQEMEYLEHIYFDAMDRVRRDYLDDISQELARRYDEEI